MPERQSRVLVVEDDASVAQVVADVLLDEGFEVGLAANGKLGLDKLEAFRPDVVVLDLMMPVLDGWGFCAAQRQLAPDLASIPVLVISGSRDARKAAAELQVAGVITKPFRLDAVIDAVSRLTGASR